MPISKGKTQIQLGPEIKRKLKYLKAKYDVVSYEEVIKKLLEDQGYLEEDD